MTGLDSVREVLAAYLKERGLDAVSAYPETDRVRSGAAVAAVSLRGCSGGAPGFQDYLGERYNEDTGGWEERYGKRLTLTFGLDLYALRAADIQSGLEVLSGALRDGGPEGMKALGFSAGEMEYIGEARRFHCGVQAEFQVWFYAVTDENGVFTDFEVKGMIER